MRRLTLFLCFLTVACGGSTASHPTFNTSSLLDTKVTQHVAPGGAAILTAHADPHIPCDLTYLPPGGESSTLGIERKGVLPDATGLLTWTWTIDPRTTTGTAHVTAKCGLSSIETPFTVG